MRDIHYTGSHGLFSNGWHDYLMAEIELGARVSYSLDQDPLEWLLDI